MNPLELRGQRSKSGINKSSRVRYASISEETKSRQKVVPRQYIKEFASECICNNLYMLVSIFIIYLQSSAKVFSAVETLQRITGSSVKSITGVTSVGKCSGRYL